MLKSKNYKGTHKAICIIVICLSLLWLTGCNLSSPTSPSDSWQKYHIKYTIILSQYEGQTKVWMPIPTQWDTQKDIQLLNFTPEPSDIFIESRGNHIVFWENILEHGTPTIFEEELELSILQKLWQIEEDLIGNYDPLDPVLNMYLGSSEYIQTDNPILQEAANSVVGTETNPYIKAKQLFNFVVEHMSGFTEGINDALGAFNSQQGECGGYSNLFIALCRAVGVPARPITGIVGIKEGSYYWANGDVYTHGWAEFYLPNYGWVSADPTYAELSNANTLGIAYGDRLILSKGADIELGHGMSRIPWFHMPYVNGHQEKGDDLILTVQVLND